MINNILEKNINHCFGEVVNKTTEKIRNHSVECAGDNLDKVRVYILR